MGKETKNSLTLIQKIGEVQKGISKLKKDKDGYKYKYFDINDLIAVLRPELEKQKLVVIQPLTHYANLITGVSNSFIKTIVSDGKDSIEYDFPLPELQIPQKMGSAVTYYRRYQLQSLFFMMAEDDDGEKVNKTPRKPSTRTTKSPVNNEREAQPIKFD